MAHCTKCGAAVADNAGFCPACGASQTATPSVTPGASPAVDIAQPQIAENIAGLLCYALGWVTGLIFYFIDKRPFVRFHATQSIVTFAGLHVIYFILGAMFGMSLFVGGLAGFSMGYMLYSLMGLVGFILWVLLMVKAFQGERFRLPVAADLADKIFGKA